MLVHNQLNLVGPSKSQKITHIELGGGLKRNCGETHFGENRKNLFNQPRNVKRLKFIWKKRFWMQLDLCPSYHSYLSSFVSSPCSWRQSPLSQTSTFFFNASIAEPNFCWTCWVSYSANASFFKAAVFFLICLQMFFFLKILCTCFSPDAFKAKRARVRRRRQRRASLIFLLRQLWFNSYSYTIAINRRDPNHSIIQQTNLFSWSLENCISRSSQSKEIINQFQPALKIYNLSFWLFHLIKTTFSLFRLFWFGQLGKAPRTILHVFSCHLTAQ